MRHLTSSSLADNRIRELLSQISFQDFDATSAQIVPWINARRHSFDMITDLVDSIYSVVTNDYFVSPRPMAQLCRELYTHIMPQVPSGIDGNAFREALLSKCAEAVSEVKSVLDGNGEGWVRQMGNWPQFIALIKFAGELFKVGLLEKDVLINLFMENLLCYADLSELKIEGLCTMLSIVGHLLDKDAAVKDDIDRYFRDLNEYSSTHCGSPQLTRLLDELHILRSNNWIAPPDEPEDSPKYLTNTPPSDFFPPGYSDSGMAESSYIEASDVTTTMGTPTASCSAADSVADDPKSYPDSAWSMPRHEQFYFSEGNLLIECEHTLFRVHTGLLCRNSPIFREMLSPENLAREEQIKGYPCLYLSDSQDDFATLLKVIYDSGFPARHKTPDFPTFSSILRMTTSYQIRNVRDQILVDLEDAYPIAFEAYEASELLGERVFGEPLPHPNAVLNLFKECDVKFALPFAFYRACRPGVVSLTTDTVGAVLPPITLNIAVKGLGKLKAAEWNAAKNILFGPKLHSCDGFSCYRSSSLYTEKNGSRIFPTIFDSITYTSADMAVNVLEPPQFTPSSVFCGECLSGWSKLHREARTRVWRSLPAIFGLSPWQTTNKAQ